MSAKAPYNFVPLNNKVVKSDFDATNTPQNKYHAERYTGYIELEIKAETRLFIKNTLTKDELKNGVDPKSINSFCAPADRKRIPGSSLRGMIRTLVEIVSYSKFVFYDNKKLYFRAVGDSTKQGIYYRNLMVNEKDNLFPKIFAGLLIKKNNKYYIKPSQKINGTQFFRVNYTPQDREFVFSPISFTPVKVENHTHKRRKKDGKFVEYLLKYALVTEYSPDVNNYNTKGYLIKSGSIPKKHMHWIITDPDPKENEILVPDGVIQDYKNDVNRIEKINLLEGLKTHTDKVPCFYLTSEQGDITVFGHTGMFRVPYSKDISNHVTQNPSDIIDMATALFGDEEKFQTRIFIEDAFLQSSDSANRTITLKNLAGPKPTCIQHYLEPNGQESANYNDATSIRGFKVYWHKNDSGAEETNQTKLREDRTKPPEKRQLVNVTPLNSGSVFKGRIKFENLSDIELGALLFVLKLKDNLRHKIGMGKPLGLGSIKITPSLHLSDRKERYNGFLSEWSGLPSNTDSLKSIDAFEKFILKEIGQEKKKSLWEVSRIKELEYLLDFNNVTISDWLEKTRYLEIEHYEEAGRKINEYKLRPVLPKPSEVIKDSKK